MVKMMWPWRGCHSCDELPPVVAEIARLGSAGMAGPCAFSNRPGAFGEVTVHEETTMLNGGRKSAASTDTFFNVGAVFMDAYDSESACHGERRDAMRAARPSWGPVLVYYPCLALSQPLCGRALCKVCRLLDGSESNQQGGGPQSWAVRSPEECNTANTIVKSHMRLWRRV